MRPNANTHVSVPTLLPSRVTASPVAICVVAKLASERGLSFIAFHPSRLHSSRNSSVGKAFAAQAPFFSRNAALLDGVSACFRLLPRRPKKSPGCVVLSFTLRRIPLARVSPGLALPGIQGDTIRFRYWQRGPAQERAHPLARPLGPMDVCRF